MEGRGQWESRTSFVLAAIGSAIGLGNIRRFPYICANNGGGAFLVAFTLAWGENTSDFFYKNTPGLTAGPFEFGGIQLSMLICLALTWVSIIACIWKGLETFGKVVCATVIIPWIILIALVVTGVTLDGAETGLAHYLFD